jgi:signal transduction histidine kinase/ActR/RegA family two-component response regulator
VPNSVLGLQATHRRLSRYLLALVIVGVATLLRAAADPLVHEQIPYFIYVASVVVATWFCGVDGGILSTIIAAFASNYFFVPPRYEFVPHGEDWIAMGTFAAVAVGLVLLVGRWKRAEESLRQRADEAQAILDTVPAAVFITRDPEARHMDGNWFTAEVLRLPHGSNVSKTAPADERPTTFRAMRGGNEIPGDQLPVQVAVARGVEVRDYEFDLVYDDGTARTLFGNATPLRDSTGHVRGAVGAFVDVTERKRMEMRLQQQAEELTHANRMKDEFLATLSHELRTPLNAIVGWSDMLRRGSLQPDAAGRAIESIYRNALAQSEMINDVLDVSRIVNGKVRIEMQPVDPTVLLGDALESVRVAAQAKGIVIVTEFGTVPVPVFGDATRLQQVFWNLLSNAIKFTPSSGQIRVALRFSGGQLQVQVADTGIGISADFLPHVFVRFRQRDSSSTRTQGGLGLGLAIVRHLVELHGGTVKAESAGEGQGATFTVTLPARPFEERRQGARHEHRVRRVPAVEPVPDDLPTLCGLRLLVVDDQDDAREVASSVLRYHGATVAVAENAGQALDQFERFQPDVLLIDLAMPEIDGYALIERIRKFGQRGAAVPAIAWTAYAREEDQRRALASGFQLHIAKPVDAHTLIRAVATVRRVEQDGTASS